MQNIQKYSSWVLYCLMALTVAAFAAFYAGGSIDPNVEYLEPVYTWLVLDLAYAAFGLGLVLTVCFALLQFGIQLKDHTKDALQTLAIFGAFIALLAISWSMGNGQELYLPGYDAEFNVPFWLKLTDMWLYASEFLLGASILTIIGFSIAKLFRK